MIKTMDLNECAAYLRAHGLSISNESLADGLEQRVYPFGVCICGGKRRIFQIYTRLVDEWIAEREVETGRFKEPPNPLVELVSRLVNEEDPSWSGTATELARCLSEMDSSRSFTPNWIVRTLNAQQDTLLRKYDIRYVSYRTKEGKALSLRWDGVR